MKTKILLPLFASAIFFSSCDTMNLFIDQENKLNREMDGTYKLTQVISQNMSSNDGGWSYNSTFDTTAATGTLTLSRTEEYYCDITFETDYPSGNNTKSFEGSYFDADSDDPTLWMETTDNSNIIPFQFYNEPSVYVEGHLEELDRGKSFVLRVSWGAWDASAHINRRFYFEKK